MNLQNREVQLRIMQLYRAFKENPAHYKLTEEDRKFLISLINVHENADIKPANGEISLYIVTYRGYATDYIVAYGRKTQIRGEEYRSVSEAIMDIIWEENIQTLLKIFTLEDVPEAFLIPAAYIELGVQNKLIPPGYTMHTNTFAEAIRAYNERGRNAQAN